MKKVITCSRHATAVIFETGPLRPAPPPSALCELCVAERDGNPNLGKGTHSRDPLDRKSAPSAFPMSPRVAAKLEEWRDKQPPQWKIDEALAEMDDARTEDIARDHMPKGSRFRRHVTYARGGSSEDGFVEVRR